MSREKRRVLIGSTEAESAPKLKQRSAFSSGEGALRKEAW